jgi:hypothetical protein
MIAEMQGHLRQCARNRPEVSIMHFALAIAAEQRQDFTEALRHFQAANEIQSKIRPFRAEAYTHLLNSIQAAKLSPSTELKKSHARPLFIVGLPRSGTTLVEQILAAHSKVVATDELPYMERIGFELERAGGYGNRLSTMTDDEKSRYRAQYLNEVARHTGTKAHHFIDKNPNNFIHIGLIRVLFPEALIINLFRDLRDNAISLYRQLFSVGHDYAASFTGIETYISGHLTIMKHWQALYPDVIRTQSYEDLVNDPDVQIKDLLDFCQLAPEPACFEFYKSKQAVLTPSASQVSVPMYTSSIGRWLVYKAAFSKEFSQLTALQESL